MPIHAPHSHLYQSVKLEVAAAKLSHAGRKSLYAPLNLVAYIDMMTMFVIFLLMSFSATGEILFVQKNIVLPDAQNWTDLERAPVIGVSKDVVTLDGSQVATADDLLKDSSTGDFKIAELHDKLVTLKNNYKLLHPGEDFNGIAIVQSDKNVEFKALKKVMYSIAVAGYQNVNFAVTPKAKGGGAPRSSVVQRYACTAGPLRGRPFFCRCSLGNFVRRFIGIRHPPPVKSSSTKPALCSSPAQEPEGVDYFDTRGMSQPPPSFPDSQVHIVLGDNGVATMSGSNTMPSTPTSR